MNTLGHPYVAFKVTGRMNPYLAAGSHLPDLVPFVQDSVFTFEEIHESPDKFLKFLDDKYPCACDLALGMMSHSVKYGADKFNNEIEGWLLTDEKEKIKLVEKIADSCAVDPEIAKHWLHNYLWNGVDLFLLYKEPQFINGLIKAHRQIDHQGIAKPLAEGFNKDPKEVRRMINFLFVPYEPELLGSLDGLVKIWKGVLKGLPQENNVNEAKTKKLFKEIYIQFENQWEDILEKVVRDVKQRMELFI